MRKPILGLAIILLAITPLTLPTAAFADDGDLPTVGELAAKCNKGTEMCVFHPDGGGSVYSGERKKVGRTIFNCGPGDATEYLDWTRSVGETVTLGGSAIAYSEGNVEFAGLSLAYKVKLEATYSHKWGTSDSVGYGQWVKVPPRSVGWITQSVPMQTLTGTYELHFKKKFHKHWYWNIYQSTVTAPAPGNAEKGITVAHARPMTPAESKGCTR